VPYIEVPWVLAEVQAEERMTKIAAAAEIARTAAADLEAAAAVAVAKSLRIMAQIP